MSDKIVMIDMEVTLTVDVPTEDSHESYSFGKELASVLLYRTGEGQPRSDVSEVKVETEDGSYETIVD